MDETNFDWDDLRLFLAVADHGGLAGAAASSGKSAPTLGRRMLALERRLGQELFERLPRGYVLTDDGKVLQKIAQQIHSHIEPTLSKASDKHAPRVKVSAGTWTTYLLCQHVEKLLQKDDILLQFIAADHILDIPHREAVIGIRNQRPTHISLAGQRINTVRFAIYAINDAIDTWACTLGSTPSARWISQQAENKYRIEVSHPRNVLDLLMLGVAKSVLPTFIGDSVDGLMRVSGEIEALEHAQWIVTHHDDRHLAEVRQVIQRIQSALSTNLHTRN